MKNWAQKFSITEAENAIVKAEGRNHIQINHFAFEKANQTVHKSKKDFVISYMRNK